MTTIACTLDPAPMRDRAATGAEIKARGLVASEPTPTGYRLHFSPGLKGELETLIAAESRCCSFMKFEFETERDELILNVAAPEEGRPVIAQLFDLDGGSSS